MTATVNASTSAGVIVTSDTSGALALQTAGTTALTISSGQYVTLVNGISNGLNVSGAGWGVLPYTANSTVIDNNSGQTRIFATGANTTTYGTLLSYAGTTNGSATLVTTIGKDLTFALQGATQSSGTGIAFPASQSASSDVNTLDDYEEGTWTPTLGGTGTSPTSSYNQQNGTYTKIGNIVSINFNLYTNSISGGGGSILVKSLPFACSSNGTDVGTAWTYNLTLSSGFPMAFRFNGANNTELLIEVMRTGNSPLALSISDWPTASIALVRGNLTYRVA
jgi:hypothetical protein